jgi:hypothetical protein
MLNDDSLRFQQARKKEWRVAAQYEEALMGSAEYFELDLLLVGVLVDKRLPPVHYRP